MALRIPFKRAQRAVDGLSAPGAIMFDMAEPIALMAAMIAARCRCRTAPWQAAE